MYVLLNHPSLLKLKKNAAPCFAMFEAAAGKADSLHIIIPALPKGVFNGAAYYSSFFTRKPLLEKKGMSKPDKGFSISESRYCLS